MNRHEIPFETYATLLSLNVPGLRTETEVRYYLETATGKIEEEPSIRFRKSPQITRLKSDRLSLNHNWKFMVDRVAPEYRDYIHTMAKLLDEHNGWLTSIDLTRKMFALDLGLTRDCISNRNGTLIRRGILAVNAPLDNELPSPETPSESPVTFT